MKKIFAALMALSLVTLSSCARHGYRYEPDTPEIEGTTAPEVISIEDLKEKTYTVGANVKEGTQKLQDSMLKKLDLTASELPEECLDAPDGWKSFTDGGITLKLPDTPEKKQEEGENFYACNIDGFDTELYYSGSEDDDTTLTALKTLMEMQNDDYKKIFESFGLDYDGTIHSMYKNLLTLTHEDIENADDETKKALSNLGAYFMFVKDAYILENDGRDVIIFHYKDNFFKDGWSAYSVNVYDDDGKQFNMEVFCKDNDTALRIAATAGIGA